MTDRLGVVYITFVILILFNYYIYLMLLLHDFYTALWKSISMIVIRCLNKDDDDDDDDFDDDV